MEAAQTLESPNTCLDSPVDDSRPFRSVKEAVAIFGERLWPPPKFSFDKDTSHSFVLSKSLNKTLELDSATNNDSVNIQSPDVSPNSSLRESYGKQAVGLLMSKDSEKHDNTVHGNDLVMIMMVLKKLESDLQETKMELKVLKEREAEAEVTLASLNAEVHKNMSKIEKAEPKEEAKSSMGSHKLGKRETDKIDIEKDKGDTMVKNLDSPTLAQILRISDYGGYFGESKKVENKLMKKKPIIPLVTNIFLWRKRSSLLHHLKIF